MLLEALVALASGWVISAPPAPYELQRAKQYEGRQVSYYGRDTLDPEDSPLTLTAEPPANQPTGFSDLTDDGRVYGRALSWAESGVYLTVGLDGKPSDRALQAIADSVEPVPPERWQALVIATSPAPERPPNGSTGIVVRRSGGWKLTALLPPGFPVAPEDKRTACVRVDYGQDMDTECDNLAAWRRVAGRVFVYGAVPARFKRVRVHALGVKRVTVRTYAARGYPLARFYAVRLPDRTCEVRVSDGRGREITPTGPAAGGSHWDRRRCRG